MPDEDVYNGDIGTIVEIDSKQNVISVDFTNAIVDFSTDFLYYLKHAWCISVHKSQGNEYQTVFCIVDVNGKYVRKASFIYGQSRVLKTAFYYGNRSLFETQVRLKLKRIRQTSLQERIYECILKVTEKKFRRFCTKK